MPTVKGSYEAVFIFSLTLGEEGVAEIKEKFKSLIEQNAEIGEIDEWGKRRLAYLINDEADGFYVLYNFVSGPEFPAELDRVSKITDGVLRSMIIRKEETKEVVKKKKRKRKRSKGGRHYECGLLIRPSHGGSRASAHPDADSRDQLQCRCRPGLPA